MALSMNGICVQILSSLAAYRTHGQYCTENDCKVVLNHLTRKFSEPLTRAGNQQYFHSTDTLGYTGKVVIDHVIPIREIMIRLFQIEDIDVTNTNVDLLSDMLQQSLILCQITTEEQEQLNENGFQQNMPLGWGVAGHEYERNIWARYQATGIYETIQHGRSPR